MATRIEDVHGPFCENFHIAVLALGFVIFPVFSLTWFRTIATRMAAGTNVVTVGLPADIAYGSFRCCATHGFAGGFVSLISFDENNHRLHLSFRTQVKKK